MRCDALALTIAAMAGMVRDLKPDLARMEAAAGSGFATATDLADWLVRQLGMPFRQAHHVTGRIVALAAERGSTLEDLPLDILQSVEPRITQAVFSVLGVANSVKSRTSYGGTAPANVRRQAETWLKRAHGGDRLRASASTRTQPLNRPESRWHWRASEASASRVRKPASGRGPGGEIGPIVRHRSGIRRESAPRCRVPPAGRSRDRP